MINASSKRFTLITDVIDIKKLERESNKILLVGICVAVMFHTLIGTLLLLKKPHITAFKPIVVDLITISPPRMTRPFTIRKKIFRKRLLTKKPFTIGKPDIGFQKILPLWMYSPGLLDTVTIDIRNELFSFFSIDELDKPYVPDDFIIEDGITRYTENIISMKEEMITIKNIEASNEGQIKGLTIYNPENKMSITGIVYIPHLWDSSWPSKNLSPGVLGLVDAVRLYTDVIAKADKHLNFWTNRSIRNPFIYIGIADLWKYKKFDVQFIREYLLNGGFVVFENLYYVSLHTTAEASLKQFIRDALGSQVRINPIHNYHPLYHIFFDFDDGPPPGAVIKNKDDHVISIPIDYIEGIFLRDRLVGIYSNKGWGRIWRMRGSTSSPQHRIGVNMVVYALRNGMKAPKKIDYTLEPGINAIRSSFSSLHSK